MVSANTDRPSDYVRFRHTDFISVNWDLLAIASFTNFLIHGPGLVLVNESCFINEPRGVLVKIHLRYVSEQSPDYAEVLGPKEKAWLKNVSADRELLVGFARPGGKFSSYRLSAASADRTPKALYEKGGCGDDPNISGQS